MQILHGTWIPQAEEGFIQNGAFYLWIETTKLKQSRKPTQRHPRQVAAADLSELLTKELGIQPPTYRKLQDFISPQYFLLPTVDNQPLPSLELSRYLETELPETFEFQHWQIDCYQTVTSAKTGGFVNNVVSLINELALSGVAQPGRHSARDRIYCSGFTTLRRSSGLSSKTSTFRL